MSLLALSGMLAIQSASTVENAPRVPDRKVTAYEITCDGTLAQLSFGERFDAGGGDQPIARSVALVRVGVGGSVVPDAAKVSAAFERMARVKFVGTSCKGNSAWFVVDYIDQEDFRNAVRKDVPVDDRIPAGRLYLTVSPTGSISMENSSPRKR